MVMAVMMAMVMVMATTGKMGRRGISEMFTSKVDDPIGPYRFLSGMGAPSHIRTGEAKLAILVFVLFFCFF